ncbi:MAG: Fur family transcriptional regulator [Acidimicrobiales bacterium]
MTPGPPAPVGTTHDRAQLALAGLAQRYTQGRRSLVGVLAGARHPLSMAEILAAQPRLAGSTAYRNLAVLADAGVVRRMSGADDFDRFELTEAISGLHHHHHLVCSGCASMLDVAAVPRLERALDEAARLAAEETGFAVGDHRIDLVGLCRSCQGAPAGRAPEATPR